MRSKDTVASLVQTSANREPEVGARSQVIEVKEEFSQAGGVSARGIDMSVDETIDISSDSESASSSEAETDLVSSEDERGAVEPLSKAPKIPKVTESPELNEVWMQNPSSKIVHAVARHGSQLSDIPITKCGRRADRSFNSVAVLTDWTAKCRVCFRGRRQPEVG